MTKIINLNSDIGEGFGAYSIGNDEAMMDIVKSANIACGFHAGDPLVMRRTVEMALQHKVSLGAHPSFPDLQGFGRRSMNLSNEELESIISYQIGALVGVANSVGGEVSHVKPHGALNNMAAEDIGLATVVTRAIRDVDESLMLLSPAGSCLSHAGKENGLVVAEEIFSDRVYGDNGNLLPRSESGSVLHDVQSCVDQVMSFLDADGIVTNTGKRIPTDIHSICVHGDTPQSIKIAKAISERLESRGVNVCALPEVIKLI